jgi:hypothetical protein
MQLFIMEEKRKPRHKKIRKMEPILPMYVSTGEKSKPIKYYVAYICFVLLVTFVVLNLVSHESVNEYAFPYIVDDYGGRRVYSKMK